MYIRAGTEQQLTEQLRPILGSEVRNELGADRIRVAAHARAAGHHGQRPHLAQPDRPPIWRRGLDVRIKRTDLPDGAPLAAAFDRMRTAREQEARSIRAQGAKQAQIIRAQADADAAQDLCGELRQGPGFL